MPREGCALLDCHWTANKKTLAEGQESEMVISAFEDKELTPITIYRGGAPKIMQN